MAKSDLETQVFRLSHSGIFTSCNYIRVCESVIQSVKHHVDVRWSFSLSLGVGKKKDPSLVSGHGNYIFGEGHGH